MKHIFNYKYVKLLLLLLKLFIKYIQLIFTLIKILNNYIVLQIPYIHSSKD